MKIQDTTVKAQLFPIGVVSIDGRKVLSVAADQRCPMAITSDGRIVGTVVRLTVEFIDDATWLVAHIQLTSDVSGYPTAAVSPESAAFVGDEFRLSGVRLLGVELGPDPAAWLSVPQIAKSDRNV